mgnify:CR=1 FL=1
MVYLKDKSMKFRLLNLEVRPDFAIWKSWEKRGEDMKDPAGNPMKFPIRDGVLTNVKGELKEVADLRFMPNKDFKEQYPTLSRKFSFNRQVVVNGVEYTYRFTITSDRRLKEKIFDLQTMSKDPLRVEFEQNHDASKLESPELEIFGEFTPELAKVEYGSPEYDKLLIKVNSNERDIVFDGFMWGGTTAVAAKQLNRRYIGFEISKEYCKIAEKRIKDGTRL